MLLRNMAFSCRHPFRAKVDDSYHFIKDLLLEYLVFLEQWEKNEIEKIRLMAKESSDGDTEIESSIISQYMSAFEDTEFRKDMFYQAILIMSYSYFESCIEYIKKNIGNGFKENEGIKAVYNRIGRALSNEENHAVDFLNDIRELRNDICHNNKGTYKRNELLLRLSQEWDGIDFCDGVLTISKHNIILETLEKSHFLLSNVCELLNYKTQRIN